MLAETIRVVDGDTIRVRALIWIDLSLEVLVRIRGIDAPELNGGCAEEETLAVAATGVLAAALGADILLLTDIDEDKYAGRIVADVATAGGADLAAAMLASGTVRAYDGGTRLPWCPLAIGVLATP
ncbi:MAG: thermonuclease family protein [Bauldia sp.]